MTKPADPAIASTQVSLDVDASAVTVQYVARAPKQGSIPENPCHDSLELSASAAFSTADGKFDEHWAPLVLAYARPEAGAPGPDWLHAAVALEPGEIEGTFAPTFDPGWCFFDLTIHIDLRPSLFSGTIQPSFISPPCDPNDPEGAIASGAAAGVWPPVSQ